MSGLIVNTQTVTLDELHRRTQQSEKIVEINRELSQIEAYMPDGFVVKKRKQNKGLSIGSYRSKSKNKQ